MYARQLHTYLSITSTGLRGSKHCHPPSIRRGLPEARRDCQAPLPAHLVSFLPKAIIKVLPRLSHRGCIPTHASHSKPSPSAMRSCIGSHVQLPTYSTYLHQVIGDLLVTRSSETFLTSLAFIRLHTSSQLPRQASQGGANGGKVSHVPLTDRQSEL